MLTCCPVMCTRLRRCAVQSIRTRSVLPISQSQQRIQRRAERPQPDVAASGVAPAIDSNQPRQTSSEPVSQQGAQAERSSRPPQQSSSPQHASHGKDGQEAVLANAIDAAVAGCIQAGALPQAQYAAGKVLHPSPKQRKQLPKDVR